MSKKNKWKLSKKWGNDYYQNVLQNKEVIWSTLNKAIETAETFFLDEKGNSLLPIDNDRIPDEASCMFCRFRIKKDKRYQSFYAFKQKGTDGEWGIIEFGTQFKFGSVELGNRLHL